jgi:hypothetical protein
VDLADSKGFAVLSTSGTGNSTYPMRKQIWLPCILLLAICCTLLVWPGSHRPAKQGIAEISVVVTNQPVNTGQVRKSEATSAAQPAVAPNSLTTMFAPSATIEESNSERQKIVGIWRVPIDFYGRVVDQSNNVIAGAQVRFHWVETPDSGGNRDAITSSDANGLFTLHGAHGPSLRVDVAKEGYYSSSERDHPPFKYGPFAMGDFAPDPLNPVVFHLHSKGKGVNLINSSFPTGMGQIAQLRHDGTPVEINLLDGLRAPAGTGQLKLELWRDISQPNGKAFDWTFQISVPGGGLVKAEDEFAFEAPETGYQPSLEVDMPATNGNWVESFTSQFYLQMPDDKFARINLYLSAYNGAFTVKSAINPSGSRNLEPDN